MSTRIGKDVLDSLTQSMYEDSRIIYREYIQNAADQIDKALQTGLIKSPREGMINIVIDTVERNVMIEDNATGVKGDEIEAVLKNIAKSTKDRTKDKGFRGIGRLGGLAYCDQLVFETSFAGEPYGYQLIWDAKLHRDVINNRSTHEDASEVIDAITRIEHFDEDISKHYFKVKLFNVTDDALLDVNDISNYLSMVAPVPFRRNQFKYTSKISRFLEDNDLTMDEYLIYVNSNIIEKLYTNYVYNGEEGKKKRCDEILDVDFFKIKKEDELLGWGWFSISSFQGVLDEVNKARGIRLRKNNIQIGLENCLEKFHKEKRGNYYFFGEIHALHPELIPNSRRDYFIDNDIEREFNRIIRSFFATKLYKAYHLASDIRSQFKPIKKMIEIKYQIDEKEVKGYQSKIEREELIEKYDVAKEKAIKSQNKILRNAASLNEDNGCEKKILTAVVKKQIDAMVDEYGDKKEEVLVIKNKLPEIIRTINGENYKDHVVIDEIDIIRSSGKTPLITDDLNNLNGSQKAILQKVFSTINKIFPKDHAEMVIKKITEDIKI